MRWRSLRGGPASQREMLRCVMVRRVEGLAVFEGALRRGDGEAS